MRISTIVPNFNHGHLIRNALESVLYQSYPPHEIIVIDDASTDSSFNVISEIALDSNKLRVIKLEKNVGAVEAGRVGVQASTGDFLHFLAADDELLPEAYKHMHSAYSKYPNASFYSGECVIVFQQSDTHSLRPIVAPANRDKYISPKDFQVLLRKADNFFLGMSTLVKRKDFEEEGGFDKTLGALSDSFFFRRLALRKGFVFVPNLISTWNLSIHGDSRKLYLSRNFEDTILPEVAIRIRSDKLFPAWYDSLFVRRQKWAILRIRYEDMLTKCKPTNTRKKPFFKFTCYKSLLMLKLSFATLIYRPYSLRLVLMNYWKRHRNFQKP